MKIFINTNSNLELRIAEIEPSSSVGKLMRQVFPDMNKNSDFEEDNEVYLQNQSDDLDKGKTLEECGIKHGDTLFIGKCKRVSVSISYVGKTFGIETTPALTLKALRKKVSEHFGMTDEEVADFQFLLGDKPITDLKLMIGSLVKYSSCSVSLVFAPKRDINGFFETPQELLKKDLDSPDYLKGEIAGEWGMHEDEMGPKGPISIFWVTARNNQRYYLRFDLTNYAQLAPTCQLWDIITNRPLEENKWPKWSKRCQQVFRAWGKPCLYLPCDRMAFEGHPSWPQEHPSLVWQSETDTIFKYINEIHQILN